ncbi:MAG: pseudouridine synthase [Lutibacter sp.]|nr:MAG: pseudouridine synthase [Lutibacter sp.]
MKIEILFEDSHIIIVNKPNNVLIHNSHYARNITDDTLLKLLNQQLGYSFYPVHRLDRKTSGVLVLAKLKEEVATFQALFTTNEIIKNYVGIVRGFVHESIHIDSPVKNPDTNLYKEAETLCEPIFTHQLDIPVHPYDSSRYSLVKLTPTTGRMHQLRIHMNKISHPIVGDYKYGDRFHNRMFEQEFSCANLFLHAYAIAFKHPFTGKSIEILAPFPKDWGIIIKKFNWEFNFN